eukprot:CAMPEP_0197246044 /NCGR_PEP_ID=MMETSP1429-20130617/10626_1 /TAXON_ID=49237 /ORGANISM="Chaetoceros  sp., Strain UNC1202" /LENGTH=299 /DNA_ID=CAMNT_0042706637 /DNA_START=163 /DNA_END=1062 /DNA_ORIENTATION=-
MWVSKVQHFAVVAAVLFLNSEHSSAFSPQSHPFSRSLHVDLHLRSSLRRARTGPFGTSIDNKLRMARKDGGNDEKKNKDFADPNPGGMSEWGDDDDQNKNKSDENFLDTIKAWMRSDEVKEDVKTYTLSLVIALLLRLTIIEPRYIPSLSMFPTFDVGDQLAVEKVTKRIRPFSRNEVVVFNPPESFREIMVNNYGGSNKKTKEALIKRIVATEGDEVKVRSGKLYINGQKQNEPFTAEDAAYEFGPVTVPTGNVLVLGDNRNHSLDGHIWGFLPKENVIGRAVFIYWPPWRLGNEGMF